MSDAAYADTGGTPIQGQPVPVAIGPTTSVFARGEFGRLRHFYFAAPGPWQVFDLTALTGGGLQGDPVVFVNANSISIFARGQMGRLVQFYNFSSTRWQLFETPSTDTGDTRIQGNPALLVAGGAVSLFARGTDNRLLQFYFTAQGPWQLFDTPSTDTGDARISGDPVVYAAPDAVSIFARGVDGRLVQFYFAGSGPWQLFETPSLDTGDTRIEGKPALALSADGVSLFARSVDNRLLQFYFTNSGPWQLLSPSIDAGDVRISGNPVVSNDGRSVFARGLDRRLLQFYQDGTGWQVFDTPSTDTGDTRIIGDPAVLPGVSRGLLFVRGHDLPCRVRVHFKLLSYPVVPLETHVQDLRSVFAPAGITIEQMNVQDLTGLHPAIAGVLNNLDVADCQWNVWPWPNTTSAQEALFAVGDPIPHTDVVVYFVNSLVGTGLLPGWILEGCATHPHSVAGCAVRAAAPRYVVAHELGHVLGLGHVDDTSRLMNPDTGWSVFPPKLSMDEANWVRRNEKVHACP